MIEIIYQGEEEKDREDSEFKLPKNVRQIGELEFETRKIYVEDFVMTFVKHFSSRHLKYGVLLGNVKRNSGNTYLFITGAVCAHPVIDNDIIFDEDVWTGIYEDIKTYFDDVEIVGWFISMPGMLANDMAQIRKLHLDNFAGNDKVCFILDRVECEDSFYLYDDGGMKKCNGHYIYYAKNADMQSYMMMNEEVSEIPADYEQSSKQAINAKVHRLLYNISGDFEEGNVIKEKRGEKKNLAKKNASKKNTISPKDNTLQKKNTSESEGKGNKEESVHTAKGNLEKQSALANEILSSGSIVSKTSEDDYQNAENGSGTTDDSREVKRRIPVFAYSASSFLLLAILLGAVTIMYASGQLSSLKGTVAKMANAGVADENGKKSDDTSDDRAKVIDVEADVTTTSGAGEGNTEKSTESENKAKTGESEGNANETKPDETKLDESKGTENQTKDGESEENANQTNTVVSGNADNNATKKTENGDSQATASVSPTSSDITYYTVKKGDTLYSISLKIYGNVNRIDDIRKANQMDSDEENIAIGQRLVLP